MTPVLEIRGLRFAWPGRSEWSLDVPALDLEPGEQMLLTGPSGCGKSTLLHLVCGLLEPAAGTVRVDGTVIGGLRSGARDHFRGRTIGVIFQSFHLLAGFSAVENVTAALLFSGVPPREHRPRAEALLEELGIDDPNRDPDELSVGQQQRVAVARALAAEPRLVVADEPTASLDPETGAAAVSLVQRTCRAHGTALLCVSHDPALEPLFGRRTSLAALRDETAGAAPA